jgi:hypothetical protein
MALLLAGIALFFRRKRIGPAIDRLRDQPDDRGAMQSLTAASILSVVLAESIVLLGYALRFLGATRWQSVPFYLAGIFLMLLWWPKRP